MVEMKASIHSAFPALSVVTLPNIKLYPTRNDSVVFRVLRFSVLMRTTLSACKPQLELEHSAPRRRFSPTVDQFKCAVEDPDTWMDFFVDLHPFWELSFLVPLDRFRKEAILRERTAGIALRLIGFLRVGSARSPCAIVPFINECASFIFHSVRVGGTSPQTH